MGFILNFIKENNLQYKNEYFRLSPKVFLISFLLLHKNKGIILEIVCDNETILNDYTTVSINKNSYEYNLLNDQDDIINLIKKELRL